MTNTINRLMFLLSTLCIACYSNSVLAQEKITLKNLPLGTIVTLNQDIQTKHFLDFFVFSSEESILIPKKGSLFHSTNHLIEAHGSMSSIQDGSVICAIGPHPEHRKEGGFFLKKGTALEIQKITNGVAGNYGSKQYTSMVLSKEYLLECATFAKHNQEHSYFTNPGELKAQLSNWINVDEVAPVKVSVPENENKGQYILFKKPFLLTAINNISSVKNGDFYYGITNKHKNCFFVANIPRDVFVQAGEIVNIKSAYIDRETKVAIIDLEGIQMRCHRDMFFFQTSIDLKGIVKATEGALEIIGISEIK